jgi:hypothetical protein
MIMVNLLELGQLLDVVDDYISLVLEQYNRSMKSIKTREKS